MPTPAAGWKCVALGWCLLLAAPAVRAQIPDQFTNLQVLPKEISKAELVGTMRDWAGSLGVRCTHCHVGPDNLVGMNFATDEKPQKVSARQMLRMVQAINRDFLAALPASDTPRGGVSCYSCHRGFPKPVPALRRVLTELALAEGGAAAVARYQELRRDHLGDGSYDFSERSLNAVATALAEAKRAEDALVVLEANAEVFPQNPDLRVRIGLVELTLGRRAEAEASFRQALALDPSHPGAKEALARLAEPEKP